MFYQDLKCVCCLFYVKYIERTPPQMQTDPSGFSFGKEVCIFNQNANTWKKKRKISVSDSVDDDRPKKRARIELRYSNPGGAAARM